MKKIYLLSLVFISILFAGCETKWTEFSVNKKAPQHFTFLDADGKVDTSFVFMGVLRKHLDISDKAVIKSISLKDITLRLSPLPGNVSKKFKIQGYIKVNSMSNPYPLFTVNDEQYIDPIAINVVAKGFILSDGVDKLNDFLRKNLILNTATEAKVYLVLTPSDGKSNVMNIDFDIDMYFNIEYTDCFATGNLGKDECN